MVVPLDIVTAPAKQPVEPTVTVDGVVAGRSTRLMSSPGPPSITSFGWADILQSGKITDVSDLQIIER